MLVFVTANEGYSSLVLDNDTEANRNAIHLQRLSYDVLTFGMNKSSGAVLYILNSPTDSHCLKKTTLFPILVGKISYAEERTARDIQTALQLTQTTVQCEIWLFKC